MRIKYINAARKHQGACGRCGAELGVGAPYLYWQFRYAGRRKRCRRAACAPRGSELTSAKWGAALAAVEDALESLVGVDKHEDLEEIISQAAEGIREVAEEYREAAEAMGGAGEANEERADQLEMAADQLEGAGLDEDDLGTAYEDAVDALETAAGEVQL